MTPLICTPVTGHTFEEFVDHLARTQQISDFVELRIDSIPKVTVDQVTTLRTLTTSKSIFTCRIATQGGGWTQSERDRYKLIQAAFALGFDYIDIEYETYTKHHFSIPPTTKLVLSAHMFTHTPPEVELQDLIQRMSDFHPAVIKIAMMIQGDEDVHTLYALLDRKAELVAEGCKLLLIGMGEQGRATRIQGPLLGCPWTYASTPWCQSAPGQLPYDEMRQIYEQS